MSKIKELKKYKNLATGLFVLMAILYLTMLFFIHKQATSWMYYVKAFSEAAMVGALADWFAVTALFRYPLGLKIPHTNLIESNKNKIGANLGDFISDNFLTSETIRPYIEDLKVSKYVVSWIEKESNLQLITTELLGIITKVIANIKEENVVEYVQKQLHTNLHNIPFSRFVSQAVQYALENKEQDKLIDAVIPEIKKYITDNKQLIYNRVVEKQPLLGLVGGKSITNQLISGLQLFLSEVEQDKQHPIREELHTKVWEWSEQITKDLQWQEKFTQMVSGYLNPTTTEHYIINLWQYISSNIVTELEEEQSAFRQYVYRNLISFSEDFKTNIDLQIKLNIWVQHSLYRLVLKNTKELGHLIERTVENWDGKELSAKLELEVGKDLQFIRVNGTLVGGLVGLVIYFLSTLWY